MYSAIDMVLDKLEKQIKKGKEKIRERRSKARAKAKLEGITLPLDEDIAQEVKVTHIEYKPMDVDEAILQMGLTTENFLVFTNARTDQINVLYRRNDGDLGLIQPQI